MRRSLATALLLIPLAAPPVAAQVLDETLVPRGQLRLQLHPAFSTWDSRFGRAPDGTNRREDLSGDLMDPTGALLFPGLGDLTARLEEMAGPLAEIPTIGATTGTLTQDLTRIDIGGHVGVTDWLTLGVVLPWVETRTAVDLVFTPDTLSGGRLGVSPNVSTPTAVDTYRSGLTAAAAAAQANATSACAAGPSAGCSSAQALATRAADLTASMGAAFDASPFFPVTGSAVGDALTQLSASLDTDLMAAGLVGIGAVVPLATESVTAETFADLPVLGGAGIEGFPVVTRKPIWGAGDLELSALLRVLDSKATAPSRGGLHYRVSAGFLARLPTATRENPDVFLDVGMGDRNLDLEGRATVGISVGPLAVAAGARYGLQRDATVTMRVAPPESVLPQVSTRQMLVWTPGAYTALEVSPSIRLTNELLLTGDYRFFQKNRDEYALVDTSLPLDPVVLASESGVTLHQVGGGFRYATVRQWQDGEASRPLELHIRVLHSVAGGGGQVPISTRVEAGVRFFKRLWGPLEGGEPEG